MSQTAGYPAPGEMLGPYRIVRRLGYGGMGVVFEALDGTLNRPVALKVISSHLADDAGFRARFVREARAQASVRSPHVVAVHSHGEVDGHLYIATELVDGGDLGDLLQEHGAPPLATAVEIIAQIASGMADAHEAGLVHRDIKPANVLLRRREHGLHAYLADFGVARQVGVESGLTMEGGTVGTPSYMAPELHTGGQAGVASDIYSLGCLLWAAIAGTPPYTGSSDYEIVTAHLEHPVPQLRLGSPAVDAVNRVLLRSMAKQPVDRYADASDMSRDLRAVAALWAAGRAAPPRRARSRMLVLTMLVALAAGLLTTLALGGGDEPSGPAVGLDEDLAAVGLSRALVAETKVSPDVAACVAEDWIARVGLEAMLEAGIFDEDLRYVDPPQEAMTERLQRALTDVATECSRGRLLTQR